MGEETDFETAFPLVDAEEQMRAVLSKLKAHCDLLEYLRVPSNDQRTFRMIIKVNDRSKLSPDNEQWGEDLLNTPMEDKCCTGEHATNMVQIRSVRAGRLVFDLWYERAQTPLQVSTSTSRQPLASNRSANSASSDLYGTFSSTQRHE
jgi:hypothetical protein